jgi:pimeloyl-ACP methyl ester carboxylesterase
MTISSRGFLRVAVAAACLLGAPAAFARSSPEFSWDDYARPHTLVNVGGRRLNLFCLGSGSPTVILDGGLGDDVTGWRKVHAAIARTTRVCAYDRAGYGFSDPGPMPRSAQALSDDLDRLIHAAHLRPPFVLVGHSLAGLHVRLFVDEHLRHVAGVVLVDPSFEHQVAKYEEVTPAYRKSNEQQLAMYRSCIDQLQVGIPPQGSSAWKECIGDPEPDLPTSVTKALLPRAFYLYQTALSEITEFEGESSNQVDSSRRSWGDLPLIVLTAGGSAPSSDRDQSTRNKVWLEAHERIAKLSSCGVNRVVPNAKHNIQISQPHAVIAAVEAVIADARAHLRLKKPR